MRAALVLLTACAASDPALTAADADHLAMSIASTLRPVAGGGELGALRDAAALVHGELPAGFRDAGGTVRGTHGGFAFAYRLACRDAWNRAIACGPATDNADVEAAWSGVLATPALVAVVSRTGVWIVNDVTADGMRFDGDGHFEYASDAGTELHELVYDASYRNVVVARGAPWPRGGLVRYDLALVHGAHALSVLAEARFHASGHATIELPDHAYALDLATGSLLRAQR